MAKKVIKTDQPIVIPGMSIKHSEIFLISDSPLISHRWSEKSKKEIRDKQQKKAKKARDVRDPEAEFNDSLYHFEGGGYGFPAVAFKAAAVNACSHVDGITKVHARGAFHIMCELIKIEGDEPIQREDMVRVGMGVADLRYRGEFKKWHCKVPIRYNANVLSLEQITNIFDTAGFSTGVGEWRPQKNGDYGMFHVARGQDENKLREAA